MIHRLLRLQLGFVVLAAGIALVIHADLGSSPWDVLHQGLDRRTPLSFGTATVAVGLLVFAGWFPLRQRPGIGTVLNVLSIGPLADLMLWLLPVPQALVWRVGALLVGTAAMGVGAATYIAAGLGNGPRDGVMMGLAARGLRVRWVRTGMEITVLVIGWLLGGTVGIGTLVAALGVGQVIDPTLRWHQLRDERRRGLSPRPAPAVETV